MRIGGGIFSPHRLTLRTTTTSYFCLNAQRSFHTLASFNFKIPKMSAASATPAVSSVPAAVPAPAKESTSGVPVAGAPVAAARPPKFDKAAAKARAAAAAAAAASAPSVPCPLRFIDVGINLTDDMFEGNYRGKQLHPADFDAILARARHFGVRSMVITSGSQPEWQHAVDLSRRLGVYCTVGCHPTRCDEFDKRAKTPEAYLAAMRKMITDNRDVVVAVGECGLDYDRLHFCKRETQLRHFPHHLKLAAELGLPLFLHDRNTGDDFFQLCQAHHAEISAVGGVVHSFTGTADHLKRLLECGFYVSLNGCSFKEPAQLDVARQVPLDRLLLETDAPWCEIRPTHASHQFIGKTLPAGIVPRWPDTCRAEAFVEGAMVKSRNEPCGMVRVFEVMYALRRDEVKSPEELAEIVWANTCRLFRVDFAAPRPAAAAAVSQ